LICIFLSNSYVFYFFISAPKRVDKMNLLWGRPSISEVTCLRECFPIRPTPPQQGRCLAQFWSVCADQTRRCNSLITIDLKSKSKNNVLCKRDLPSSVCLRAKIHPYPYHSKSYMRNKIDLEKLHSNLSIRISTKCTIQFAQSFFHFQFKIGINFDIGGGDPIAIG
jgi:hypothetical protein